MNKEKVHKILRLFPIKPILVVIIGSVAMFLASKLEPQTGVYLIVILLTTTLTIIGIVWWDIISKLNILEDKIDTTTITTRTK